MSSHREAPEISKDPVADNSDVYAFVSPDAPSTVTLIANFIPMQNPMGGPNFFEFGDDVLYEIHVCNRGDGVPDVSYQFRFTTKIRNRSTFLYNTGPITHIADSTFNRPQTYTVSRKERGANPVVLRSGLTVPPVNVGIRSTPDYAHFTHEATHSLRGGRKVFAGQRADAFFADLGSIFDLGALRPFQNLHLIPSAAATMGVNGLQGLNVHSIAIQVPKTDLTRGGANPSNPTSSLSVIGVYASASRQKTTVINRATGKREGHGPFTQVSRLGNPLFNEVIVPMSRKDYWNTTAPSNDAQFAQYVTKPELAGLLPVLYPDVFPHLKAYTKPRADLAAILLTGIPSGVVSGFQNYTGSTQADLLRLNLAIPPAASPSPYGILGKDLAGFPNGRRVTDDIVAIELRAVAGATIALVDPSYTADGAAAVLVDGTSNTNSPLLKHFPYLGTPAGGYQSLPGTPAT
ncbi:MAG: DUF4331 domain-containing protein [Dermatophilaceae bacterium]|nr:DUF4331 domain-containing protein [Dermatophilaceae bacterium]